MLMIGWTTLETLAQAESLAQDLVSEHLAACVQIDAPITSHYLWNGRLEKTTEYRLWIKFIDSRESELKSRLLTLHPYETPEWITVRAENVSEKYLSWAKANTYN